MDLLSYSDGSYSTSDEGGRGDVYALAPRIYPVPDYLQEYESLRKAMNVAIDTCALQYGVCWVVSRDRSRAAPACGQPSGKPCPSAQAPAAEAGTLAEFSREFRRTAVSNAARSVWKPVAAVTPNGVAAVAQGCVLPFWQRIFFNTGIDHFRSEAPSATYRAAVAAAMVLADRQRRTRVVCAECPRTKRVVPMVYVDPGGLVRNAADWQVGPTSVEQIDRLEFDQFRAASRGASLMPFNM
jgi:hypothetical protein